MRHPLFRLGSVAHRGRRAVCCRANASAAQARARGPRGRRRRQRRLAGRAAREPAAQPAPAPPPRSVACAGASSALDDSNQAVPRRAPRTAHGDSHSGSAATAQPSQGATAARRPADGRHRRAARIGAVAAHGQIVAPCRPLLRRLLAVGVRLAWASAATTEAFTIRTSSTIRFALVWRLRRYGGYGYPSYGYGSASGYGSSTDRGGRRAAAEDQAARRPGVRRRLLRRHRRRLRRRLPAAAPRVRSASDRSASAGIRNAHLRRRRSGSTRRRNTRASCSGFST